MALFLTDDWFAEVTAAAPAVDPDVSLVLEQHVRGAPGGEIRYRLTLGDGRLRMAAVDEHGEAGPPDATMRMDYATAVGLATGQLTIHDAFLEAKVRVSGNVALLQAAGAALSIAAEALDGVRERTSF